MGLTTAVATRSDDVFIAAAELRAQITSIPQTICVISLGGDDGNDGFFGPGTRPVFNL